MTRGPRPTTAAIGTLLLVALVGLVAPATGASASAPSPLIGGRIDQWNLSDLGGRPPLRLEPGRASARVRFRLPAETRQGQPLWYLARLHASALFAPEVTGKFLLVADLNGATVAQIPLIVSADSIRVEELGLIGGRRSRTVTGREVSVDFRNYVQISGVRPAENVLRFALEPVTARGLTRPRAFTVAILANSGIETTRALPDELLLNADSATITAPVGQPVQVGYVLRRRGGRPDGPVDVSFGAGGLEVEGSEVQHLPGIGTEVHRSFTAVGRAPGTYMLMIAVPDRFNQPSAAVTITITPAGSAGVFSHGAAKFAGAGVLVLSGLALLMVGWVRTRRAERPSQAQA